MKKKNAPFRARRGEGQTVADRRDYIGVFDSGVGGLSVLRQLRRVLPGEKFLYFGDSRNAPYGTRPVEEVRALTFRAAETLMARGLKALVVACNTATSAAIAPLRQKYPDRIIVGIEPALKPAAERFPGGSIGVMATPMTIREEKFQSLLAHWRGKCRLTLLPAPGLVELVESGKGDSPEADRLLESLFGEHMGKLDALVLGCTHYPFAAASIRRVLGPETVLFDGGEGTARETRRRLSQADLLENGPGELILENSLGTESIRRLSEKLLEQ